MFRFFRQMSLAVFFLTSLQLYAGSHAPDLPPSPCYDSNNGGCNEFMSQVVSDFENLGHLISFESAVYSGTCRHLGAYSSDVDHYAVVMIDQLNNAPRFSTMFSFFAPRNEFSEWSLATSRKEMSSYWNDHGVILTGSDTARIEIKDDAANPVYIYWLRQNPFTQELYYITYAGFSLKSFCRLEKNKTQ